MDLSQYLYLRLTHFIRSSLRQILMREQVALEILLPRVQRGEGPKVDKAILSLSIILGRIEEMGKKMERKNVVYIRLFTYLSTSLLISLLWNISNMDSRIEESVPSCTH